MDTKLLETYTANHTVMTPDLVQAVVDTGSLSYEAVVFPVLKAIARGSCIDFRECARIAAAYHEQVQKHDGSISTNQAERDRAA